MCNITFSLFISCNIIFYYFSISLFKLPFYLLFLGVDFFFTKCIWFYFYCYSISQGYQHLLHLHFLLLSSYCVFEHSRAQEFPLGLIKFIIILQKCSTSSIVWFKYTICWWVCPNFFPIINKFPMINWLGSWMARLRCDDAASTL